MEATHSRLIYYIRGDKEFQGEPERVYGANWAKTGSKWASNPHIREGRGQIDQKSANTVGYDPEDGVQRAPNLRILLLLPRIDFPVCLYFFCNMPSDCELPDKSLLTGQKLVENAKIEKLKMRHF